MCWSQPKIAKPVEVKLMSKMTFVNRLTKNIAPPQVALNHKIQLLSVLWMLDLPEYNVRHRLFTLTWPCWCRKYAAPKRCAQNMSRKKTLHENQLAAIATSTKMWILIHCAQSTRTGKRAKISKNQKSPRQTRQMIGKYRKRCLLFKVNLKDY